MTSSTADPASLANLADIVLTVPPPFWPPATGVWIVAAALAAMLCVALWRGIRRYRANAFLRDADASLAGLASQGWANDADLAEAMSTILKRAALTVYGRERVAGLTGAAWRVFLAQTMPAGASPPLLAAARETSADETQASIAAARAWLRARRHRPEQSGKGG